MKSKRLNIAQIHRYLNKKYDGLFGKTRKSLAYRRLWILYKELSMGYLDIPYRDIPYKEVLGKQVREGRFYYEFQKEAISIVENNDFWDASGQQWLEDDQEGAEYFGRLVFLIMLHYDLSDKEIIDITHIRSPHTCLCKWFLKCIQLDWIVMTRIVKLEKTDVCRDGLVKMAIEMFEMDPQVARWLKNGSLIYDLIWESLAWGIPTRTKTSLELFYKVEYMGESPDSTIEITEWVRIYKESMAHLNKELKRLLERNGILTPRKIRCSTVGWVTDYIEVSL